MTIQKCIYLCGSNGYTYAGLEYHDECYCGNEPEGGFVWTWQDRCSASCSGDRRQDCGGSSALSIYTTVMDGWWYFAQGQCMYDFPENRRVLSNYAEIGNEDMTISACSNFCFEKLGWGSYYGVENGKDCWCGDWDSAEKFLPTHDDQCDTPCSGNEFETCGGSNYRIHVRVHWLFDQDGEAVLTNSRTDDEFGK